MWKRLVWWEIGANPNIWTSTVFVPIQKDKRMVEDRQKYRRIIEESSLAEKLYAEIETDVLLCSIVRGAVMSRPRSDYGHPEMYLIQWVRQWGCRGKPSRSLVSRPVLRESLTYYLSPRWGYGHLTFTTNKELIRLKKMLGIVTY